MTYSEILIKVLEKAITNGFDLCGWLTPVNCNQWQKCVHEWQGIIDLEFMAYGKKRVLCFERIIFDHDFAIAYFGKSLKTEHDGWYEDEYVASENMGKEDDGCPQIEAWTFHLQELISLATAEKRLLYLQKFL